MDFLALFVLLMEFKSFALLFCTEPPDKCSAKMKDRYCDQSCTINKTSPLNPQCGCEEGFVQRIVHKDSLSNSYTECIPGILMLIQYVNNLKDQRTCCNLWQVAACNIEHVVDY